MSTRTTLISLAFILVAGFYVEPGLAADPGDPLKIRESTVHTAPLKEPATDGKTVYLFVIVTTAALLAAALMVLRNRWLAKKILRQRLELDDLKAQITALEGRYQSIADTIAEGVFELDLAGNFVSWNDSLCRILKSTETTLAGNNILAFAAEALTDKMIDDLDRVRQSAKPMTAITWPLVLADGSGCSVQVTVDPLNDPDGRITGFRGIVRDTTDVQQLEEETRSLAARLQQAQKMAAVGDLAAGAAYDLHHLMTSIAGHVSLLLHSMNDTHPDYQRLKLVEQHVQTGTKWIGQLLQNSQPDDAASLTGPQEARRGQILLVDDEVMVLNVGSRMLDKLGYRVLCASDGPTAVDIFRKQGHTIDLVILDMIMPGMNGVEVFKALRLIDPHLRVLLASGHSLNAQVDYLMQQGCRGFVQKPFSLKQLSQKMSEIME